MSLVDAVTKAGPMPPANARQQDKKAYSERLSRNLAEELAEGLRDVGFPGVKPLRGGPQEKEFQGGLGPKKVDVSYADERHGLLLAVSIKTITARDPKTNNYNKNLKNRFGDMCAEAITLHMRFPYSVVCAMMAFPSGADSDTSRGRPVSTLRKALKLFSTITGRDEHADPAEKFENMALLLFDPSVGDTEPSCIRLVDAKTLREISECDYFVNLRKLYNRRNPHAMVGEEEDILGDDAP